MSRVVLGRPQHVSNRLWYDGYKDERLYRGSCQEKYKSQHTVDKLQSEGYEDIHQRRELCTKIILGRQRTTTLKFVTKRVPQHVVDRLWSEGCEDRRQCGGSCSGNLKCQHTADRQDRVLICNGRLCQSLSWRLLLYIGNILWCKGCED